MPHIDSRLQLDARAGETLGEQGGPTVTGGLSSDAVGTVEGGWDKPLETPDRAGRRIRAQEEFIEYLTKLFPLWEMDCLQPQPVEIDVVSLTLRMHADRRIIHVDWSDSTGELGAKGGSLSKSLRSLRRST